MVVAHPGADSFCAALATQAVGELRAHGFSVALQDLYADGFDPRMPLAEVGTTFMADELVSRYAAEVLAADVIVVVHPVWFFHVPGILKGWVDRVLREGIVYELRGGGESVGRLRARSALLLNTANAPESVEAEVLGDPLDVFWRRVVFAPAGVSDVRRLRFAKVAGSSAAQRAAWLAEARLALSALASEAS